MEGHGSPEKNYSLERLVFFSDGVFAIVVTLLALELQPPKGWDHTLVGLWRAEWRSISAFALSFCAVAAYWNAHRVLFSRISSFKVGLVLPNMALLGLITLVPFATSLIYETGPRGEPFAMYVGLLSAIAAMQALLWGVASFIADVVTPSLNMAQRRTIFLSMLLVPLFLMLWSAMLFFGRPFEECLWLIVPLVALRQLRRRTEREV